MLLMTLACRYSLLYLFLFLGHRVVAQPIFNDSVDNKVIIAGPQYNRSHSFQKLWGINRRKEWLTSVTAPSLSLDSAYGGLQPYKPGGGNETKSLKLRSATGKEYALRSINKSRKDVISPYFENTFIADIIQDGVSMSYPYGAFALANMQEKAGIPHTVPMLVYVSQQVALDTFNKKYGNDLYMLEQKAEGDWSESDNLGNFSSFISTEEVVRNTLRNHNHLPVQSAFVKARLFDMLIGDWDRHEDNWAWGKKKIGSLVMYVPVPKDRDQAFYTHKGIFIDAMISAAGLGFMQNFDYHLKHMEILNREEKDIDRLLTNNMDRNDWMREALAIQKSLTDDVIEQSVRQLPPEIFAISGNELIEKIKSRAKDLPAVASSYYQFLAKKVDVVGTKQREFFQVSENTTKEVTVTITRINSDGSNEDTPYYKRVFNQNETNEIRLYGIGGGDVFRIDHPSRNIKIRIVGNRKQDTIQKLAGRMQFYEESDSYFQSKSVRMRLSSDTDVIRYKYDWFNYNSKGFSPVVSYNYEDRLYAGIHYRMKLYKWRRDPLATTQRFGLNYSFSQRAVSANYDGLFPNLIGRWNLVLRGNYDAIQWTNFFGLGNESIKEPHDIEYYRMHIRSWSLHGGVSTAFGKSNLEVLGFYQNVAIRNDSTLHVAKVFEATQSNIFQTNEFAGLYLTYKYAWVNDSIITTKGITFLMHGIYSTNVTQNIFFQHYDARAQTYLPLGSKFSLLIRAGGTTVVGPSEILMNALPIQHAVIGGPDNLRGYQFDRFWGRTSFYNNNEIRFITDLRTYILNAKIGLSAFFDDGKVWMPEENSNTIHTSYGAGFIFSPFHFMSCTLTYGIAPESKLFQFKINTLF